MNPTPGHFIWRELISTDVNRSKTFYGELFNWSFEAMPMEGMEYLIAKADGKGIGGLMAPPPRALSDRSACGGREAGGDPPHA